MLGLFRRLVASSSPTRQVARRPRLCLEDLEGRDVPAIYSFQVNTTNDTPFAVYAPKFPMGPPVPQDANGNTSLRAVIEWGNANLLGGVWNGDRVDVSLNAIAGGTITLANNASLVLQKNFNITSSGLPVTLDCVPPQNAIPFRHFLISAGTESHFYNLSLKHGFSSTNGGSIRNNGVAIVQNCTFTDNSADEYGGAVATESGASSFLEYCTFTHNTVGIPGFSNGGGAVASLGGSGTTIQFCTFTQNEAISLGGAVYAYGATSLSIGGSTINNNKTTGALSSGGGVFLLGVIQANFNGTSITNNTAGLNGGGLSVGDCYLTMYGGSISGNTAGGNGGGFFISAVGCTVTLSQVGVTNNTAADTGGGGYLAKGTLAGSLTALTGNTAGAIPGLGWKTGSTATITVPPNQQTKVNDP